MKFNKYLHLFLSLIFFSCTEQEFQNDNGSVNLDDSSSNNPVSFQIDEGTRFETDNAITFQNQSRNMVSYQWDFGDGTTETAESPTHSYTDPGKYIVTLTGTTRSGNELTYSQDLFIRKEGSELDILFISFDDSTLNYVDLSTRASTVLYNVPYNPGGVLALDETNRKVYYYDYTNNTIIENDLVLDNPVVILRDLPGVTDIEFDQSTGELYIALTFDDLIISYNPSTGSFIRAPQTANLGRFGKVRDMDLKGGELYTITPTQNYESIFRLSMSQGNLIQVIDYARAGYGYGVAYDDRNDKIYFNNVEETALMRANADGSNIEKVVDLDRFRTVSFAGLALTGLEVVETRNIVMWSSWDDGTLYIRDLDTDIEGVFEIEGLKGKFVPFENYYLGTE